MVPSGVCLLGLVKLNRPGIPGGSDS